MRFATIGTSAIVDRFLVAGAQTPGFTHAVAYTRERQHGVDLITRNGTAARVVASLTELAAADDVDAVYIASPNALHRDQAIAMLRAGKHVLVEKTAASNAREWREMLQVARDADRLLLESLRSLFDPSLAVIRELLAQLGPVRRASFSYCQFSSRYNRFLAGERMNIFDPAMSAGGLMDIGTYCVNPLVHLFGSPRHVAAAAYLLANGIDGSGTVLCTYDDMIAEIVYSKVTHTDVPSQIQGERQTLLIDVIHDPRHLRLIDASGHSTDIVIDKPLPQQSYVLQAFDRLVTDPVAAAAFNATTLAALELMDAARAQLGVRFPADDVASDTSPTAD